MIKLDRFIIMILILSLITIGVTYFIFSFTKRIKIIKYLPGIATAIMAVYYFYMIKEPNVGFEGIAIAILMIALGWISLINFVTGIFIDFFVPMLKKGEGDKL